MLKGQRSPMRAIIFRHHDPSPDVYSFVDDAPQPQPGAGEVLVRVAYAALNRLDDFVRIGWKGLDLEFPHIPCSDFSGEIVAVGAGVTEWQPGRRVTANPLICCESKYGRIIGAACALEITTMGIAPRVELVCSIHARAESALSVTMTKAVNCERVVIPLHGSAAQAGLR